MTTSRASATKTAPVKKSVAPAQTPQSLPPAGSSARPKGSSAVKIQKELTGKKSKKLKDPKVTKTERPPKVKVALVRDSFTMPKAEFEVIANLKKRAMQVGVAAKKSEVIRAGVQALNDLSPQDLGAALGRLTPIKLGRPKKA